MIVSYHNYQLDNELFIDGANYYYIENTKLLQECTLPNVKPVPHNFRNLVLGKEKLLKLTGDDVLLCNVGPYAHVYYYLRDKYNLKFRIVRDVQTCLWPGYLFQEKLCNPHMREGDKVMFLSEFTRQLYIRLFPGVLHNENTCICAPFMHFFPKKIDKKKRDNEDLVLGWVGRVTPEKNFFQALDAFIKLNKGLGNVKFIVAGNSGNRTKLRINKRLKKNGIKSQDFIYLNNGHFIPHDKVWEVYNAMDVFLFPSVSINESLGRTMVEACYMGVPVVAPYYGAAPELLNKKNLVSVNYENKLFQLDTAYPYSFGKISMDEFIEKLYDPKKLSKQTNIDTYKDHHRKFFDILQGKNLKEKPLKLNKQVKDFINRLYIYNDRFNPDMSKVVKRTARFLIGNTDNVGLTHGKPKLTENKYTKITYSKENFYILQQYNFFLSAFLNYNPYASLDENSLRVRFQKVLMHLKQPVKKPFKLALYSYIRFKYLKTYPAQFYDPAVQK